MLERYVATSQLFYVLGWGNTFWVDLRLCLWQTR